MLLASSNNFKTSLQKSVALFLTPPPLLNHTHALTATDDSRNLWLKEPKHGPSGAYLGCRLFGCHQQDAESWCSEEVRSSASEPGAPTPISSLSLF